MAEPRPATAPLGARDYPHDVDPAVWTREGVNRFARADGAAIFGMGHGRWCASMRDGDREVALHNQRGSARKFNSAGQAARFFALHHPQKGPAK